MVDYYMVGQMAERWAKMMVGEKIRKRVGQMVEENVHYIMVGYLIDQMAGCWAEMMAAAKVGETVGQIIEKADRLGQLSRVMTIL